MGKEKKIELFTHNIAKHIQSDAITVKCELHLNVHSSNLGLHPHRSRSNNDKPILTPAYLALIYVSLLGEASFRFR